MTPEELNDLRRRVVELTQHDVQLGYVLELIVSILARVGTPVELELVSPAQPVQEGEN